MTQKVESFLLNGTNQIKFDLKLTWPEDSERTFRSSSQAATCLPHTVEALQFTLSLLIAERKAGKL